MKRECKKAVKKLNYDCIPADILVAGWVPEPTRAAIDVRQNGLDRASRDARVMQIGYAALSWSGSFRCPTSIFYEL